ncbi:hypothetical protein RP20_CCG004778 [Aedes albopictus]|nr:hypothetical protein RP20_CCG004778 [Aedes albopictus]
MESQLCTMCQREGIPLENISAKNKVLLEELASIFGMERNTFHGHTLCTDCTKMCGLTQNVAIRKRRQAEEQEQRASSKQERNPSGRRSSSVGQSEPKLSLAKRMRLAQEADRRKKEIQFARSNETVENLSPEGNGNVAGGSGEGRVGDE